MARKILLVSKYPPLQGGIASRTYWLAQGIARRGWKVDVVTHSGQTAPQYSCVCNCAARSADSRISVHFISDALPWHIPDDPERTLTILERCLAIVDSAGTDVVDSGYLIPYGTVGYLLQRLRQVAHVVRHGGSDIAKFLDAGAFPALLRDTLHAANAVITDTLNEQRIRAIRQDAVCLPAYVPPEVFSPSTLPGDHPLRVAYVGKVNYHWRFKRLDSVAAIMGSLPPDVGALFVAQGDGLESFRAAIEPDVVSRIDWHPFVHPAEMPGLLRNLDAVFAFTAALPHPDFSNLVAEALCAGTGVITDAAALADTYANIVVPGRNQILVIPAREASASSARLIAHWLRERREGTISPPARTLTFEEYVRLNEVVYDTAASVMC